MKSIFYAEQNKGGVITYRSEITKRKSYLCDRKLSDEERKAMCEHKYGDKKLTSKHL